MINTQYITLHLEKNSHTVSTNANQFKMKIKREQILLALQSALIGKIYNSIRAIVFKYDSVNHFFLLRYYLDKEPTDEDFENIEIVISEFTSDFKFTDFNNIKGECIYTTKPLSNLDVMDRIIYCRKEN